MDSSRETTNNTLSSTPAQWKLYCDGASRNNPGKSGAGIYIVRDDKVFAKEYYYLGIKTNNEAEYLALLLGLHLIEPAWQSGDILNIFADSQLLIRQLARQYRVKMPHLIALYECAQAFLAGKKVTLTHVMREHNKVADKLANLGVDKGAQPPEAFSTFCTRHHA